MKMFRIENDRDCFYQWDLNQRLIVSGLQEGDEVHFASGRDKAAEAPVLSVYTENDMNVVDVPNSLLQTAGSLQAYAYIHTDDGAYTKWEESFFIIRRPKPADYVYTETEVRTWAELDERLKKVEEKEISSEAIAEAVEAYMEENPVEETDPTVPAWAKAETKPTYTAEEVGAVAADNLQDAVDDALTQAKASGEFDGVSVTHEWNGTVLSVTSASGTSSADLKGEQGEPGEDGQDGSPGADGYTPVKGVDYFTEADKQEIAEQAAQFVEVPEVEIPEALPNPNAITFTGAVTFDYDGSESAEIEIPKVNNWRLIGEYTVEEDVSDGVWCGVSADMDGNPLDLKHMVVVFNALTSSSNLTVSFQASAPNNFNANYVAMDLKLSNNTISVMYCELINIFDTASLIRTTYNTGTTANAVSASSTFRWNRRQNVNGAWVVPTPMTGCSFCLPSGVLAGTTYTVWGVDRV